MLLKKICLLEKNPQFGAKDSASILKKCFMFKTRDVFQDTQTDCIQDTAQKMKLKRLKASIATMTRQTDAEQRRPTIKKLEVKQVEFKLGEDCWEIQNTKRAKVTTCPLSVTVGDGYNIATTILGIQWLSIVEEFIDVFGVLKELPPSRPCDHRNTLLEEVSLLRLEGLPTELQPELQAVVEEFVNVFAILKELPPSRPCDHRNTLLEGTKPMNVRPYRHPLTQKDAIESMVQELLDTGVIRPRYHQIRMFGDDVAKTAFKTHHGHYEFLSLQEYVEYLIAVLEVMRQHQLYAKLSKCVFGSKKVEYLGHVISGLGVATDPSKIKAMESWHVPNNVK
ncbi:hypothetical protein Tco_1015833 [Tanacetum coccineum]|uniref:Uncharacterized protein n=1 Tax=Tanacetum coccineum TaxID=301880 RepID=A0ABQ5FN86_9ASTR